MIEYSNYQYRCEKCGLAQFCFHRGDLGDGERIYLGAICKNCCNYNYLCKSNVVPISLEDIPNQSKEAVENSVADLKYWTCPYCNRKFFDEWEAKRCSRSCFVDNCNHDQGYIHHVVEAEDGYEGDYILFLSRKCVICDNKETVRYHPGPDNVELVREMYKKALLKESL